MRNAVIDTLVRHRRLVLNLSLVFAFTCFLGLLYLSYIVVQGRDDPDRRSELARRIAEYEIPEDFFLSTAIYSQVSRFALFTNPVTGQRILLTHKRSGSERTPDGFKSLFWPAGKTIPAYTRHGGFHDLVIASTDTIHLPEMETLVARGAFIRNESPMEGVLALVRFSGDKRSIFVVSDAPQGSYDDEAFREFIRGLGPGPSVATE